MYYFIGIKGTGMSALAVILKQLGYSVSGSDVAKHFFTESELIKNNIPFYEYHPNNIQKEFTIIKGASIKEDNIELKKARELNLTILEYNEMVGELTKQFKTICIAGCHGKTTTTNMFSLAFQNQGISYLIGDGTGSAKKENTYFALESCEYQRHFLKYHPYIAVITNIDLDHVDYYKDINDVIDAYTSYANNASKLIVAYGDDPYTRTMKVEKPIIFYGLEENNNVIAKNIEYKSDGISFDVKNYGHFDLPLYGKHQLLDVLAVITVCITEKIPYEEVANNLKNFKGAKRRFTETIIGNNIMIDDYAHHPTEMTATLKTAREMDYDRIICVFQPHTYSRTKALLPEFIEALRLCDKAILADIYAAREQNTYGISSKDIADALDGGEYYDSFEKIEARLLEIAQPGDLIITMGAGNVNTIGPAICAEES